MTSSPKRLGAAKVEALQNSVQTAPPAGIGDAFSFVRAAGRAIDQMRHICGNCQLPPPSPVVVTYVFCDDLETSADPNIFEDVNRVWTSDSSIKLSDVENRVILISRSGGAGCKSKATYSTMSAQADVIAALQLHNAAAVVFQLNSSIATVYPHGIAANDFEHRPFGTVSSLLIGQELDNTLNHFDETWTNAPQGHAKLWASIPGYSHVPVESTEKVIQEQMQLVLASVDRSGVVVQEIPNYDGRADLFLYSDTPAGRHSVVLELKVLRSHSFPSKRIDGKVSTVAKTTNTYNAEEVVKQAHCYQMKLQTQRACARLYDMRKPPIDKTIATMAQTLANKLGVELCVSQIHYTAQAKRNDKIDQELGQQAANNVQ